MRSRFERPNLPIGPVLESYGADLSRARHSGWSKLACPFHSDSSPSATVNLSINRFQCWVGCTDRAEDTVGLLMHVECLPFLDALRLAETITNTSHDRVQRVRRPSTDLFTGTWTD